jgi:putative component of membrane protein insertase Oxa1/YidC/SpoIIIJ protein YidD
MPNVKIRGIYLYIWYFFRCQNFKKGGQNQKSNNNLIKNHTSKKEKKGIIL